MQKTNLNLKKISQNTQQHPALEQQKISLH